MSAPLRPPRLRPGDTIAVVSPSWGGPAAFPRTFEAGLAVLRDDLGLVVREMPHARAAAATPAERVADLHAAWADPDVRAIVASIGGDDSIRLLPLLDRERIAAHPKILMGYSDTTTLLVAVHLLGQVTFHGPSVMAGLAQARALPPTFLEHVRAVLFAPAPSLGLAPYGTYCDGYPAWEVAGNEAAAGPMRPDAGWRFLQGRGRVAGRLFGGCIEVLDWIRGSRFWPGDDFWDGRVLFLETSEEVPPPSAVRRTLRWYALAGILGRIAALVVGRARGYDDAQKRELDDVLVESAAEAGRPELPIVSNVDVGHTDPQLIFPLGVELAVDCERRSLTLTEPAVAPFDAA